MNIELYKPLTFQGIGRKENQEDNFYLDPENRFFILCDGMGGHADGEVASKTVCGALSDFFHTNKTENFEVSEDYINRAVEFAYQALDAKDEEENEIKKMGTTLTLVYFGNNGVMTAYIGDSRVYQIRPSDKGNPIKIKTFDHSYVNALVATGQITPEEARTHPKRNIVTKCMQPHSDRDMPDFYSENVRMGDYFFLCSDGILENITDEILCQVLAENISEDEKIKKLEEQCKGKTRDNYTCILLKIKDLEFPKIKLSLYENEDSDDEILETQTIEPEPEKSVAENRPSEKKAENFLSSVKDFVSSLIKRNEL
ncbi:MAG: serine/threonine-protein phosphatase [Bacteroidales bacterium]|nr:serine/threonine-protein phosphatase [Bacteroidales bacterium]